MFRFWKSLSPRAERTPSKNRRSMLATVETLERREVLAAGVSVVGTALTINATNHGDWAYVNWNTKNTSTPYDDTVDVSWTHEGVKSVVMTPRYKDVLTPDGLHQQQYNVLSVRFNGGSGNDVFSNNTALNSTANGYDGDDVITGGDVSDILEGGKGSDKLYGRGGHDSLYASRFGDNDASVPYFVDNLDGGGDRDELYGAQRGTNIIHGGGGNDYIRGADRAANYLYGDAGNDEIYGGYGKYSYNVLVDHVGADFFGGGAGGSSNLIFADDGTPDDKIYIYKGDLSSLYVDVKIFSPKNDFVKLWDPSNPYGK